MVIRLIVGSIFLMSAAAQAESLPDPTRPPGGLEATSASVAAPSGPLLQLIRTLDGKRTAIISGQVVRVGGKVGDAVVARIDEDRVVLRGPTGMVMLKLFPDVEKTPTASSTHDATPQAYKKRDKLESKK